MTAKYDSENTTSRRSVLRRGAKLAYVAPAVVVALKAESAMAGGPSNDSDKKDKKDKKDK